MSRVVSKVVSVVNGASAFADAGGVNTVAMLAQATDNFHVQKLAFLTLTTAAEHSTSTSGPVIAGAIASASQLPQVLAQRTAPSAARIPAAAAGSVDTSGPEEHSAAAVAAVGFGLVPMVCKASITGAVLLAEQGEVLWVVHRILTAPDAAQAALAAYALRVMGTPTQRKKRAVATCVSRQSG